MRDFGGCRFTVAGVQVDMWRVEDNRIGLLRTDSRHRTITDVLQRGVTLTTDRGAVVLGHTAASDADLSPLLLDGLTSGARCNFRRALTTSRPRRCGRCCSASYQVSPVASAIS